MDGIPEESAKDTYTPREVWVTVAPTGEHYLSREVLPGDPDLDAVAELIEAAKAFLDKVPEPQVNVGLKCAGMRLEQALTKVEAKNPST